MRRSETKMVARLATTLIAFGLGAFAIVQASTDSYDYAKLKQFRKNLEIPKNKNNNNNNNNNNNALKILNYERRALEKDHALIRKRSIKEEDEDRKKDTEKLKEREKWGEQTRLISRQETEKRKRYKRESDIAKVSVPEEAERSEISTSGTYEMQEKGKSWATSVRPTNKEEHEDDENEKTGLTKNVANREKLQEEKTRVESSGNTKNDPREATEEEEDLVPKFSTDTKRDMTEKSSRNNGKSITNELALETSKKKKKKKKMIKQKPNKNKTYRDSNEEETFAKLQTGRWGMSVKGPPAEFLKDIQNSRRSKSREAAKAILPESRFNREPKMDRRSTSRTADNSTKPDERSNKLKNGRWGMSMTSPPAAFLRDMSRRGFVQGNRRFELANVRGTSRAKEENRKLSKSDDEADSASDSSRQIARERVERTKLIEHTSNFVGSSPSDGRMYNEDKRASDEFYGFLLGIRVGGLLASPKSKAWKNSIDILMPSFLTVGHEANFQNGLPSFPTNVRQRETRAGIIQHKVPVVCTYVSYSNEFDTLCRFVRDIDASLMYDI